MTPGFDSWAQSEHDSHHCHNCGADQRASLALGLEEPSGRRPPPPNLKNFRGTVSYATCLGCPRDVRCSECPVTADEQLGRARRAEYQSPYPRPRRRWFRNPFRREEQA